MTVFILRDDVDAYVGGYAGAAMPERPWGYWTEQKLSMLSDYLPRFTTASRRARTTVYLDLFAGDVENVSRTTGAAISGSPKVALDTVPPFGTVVLFELPTAATRLDQQLHQNYPGRDLRIYPGDCNFTIDHALRNLMPLASAPTFALIDQYAAEIHWATIAKLAGFKRRSPYKVELWLLFASSMLPRGLAQDDPGRVVQFADRITAMYGTDAWRQIHAARLDGRLSPADARYELVNLMRWRLERVLRYRITHTFEMKNTRGVPMYEMIFATDNAAGNRIMSHIYGLAAERQPRMREEAVAKLQAIEEERRGELTLFPPVPRIVKAAALYQHRPPEVPYHLR
jgi:three-Cys-motif partner protein